MALSDGKKSKRGAKGSTESGVESQAPDRDVGHALRSVYSKTASEEIPAELLDLLGKLN